MAKKLMGQKRRTFSDFGCLNPVVRVKQNKKGRGSYKRKGRRKEVK